jgi:ABC-2 type transport system ATP-binding protein
VVESPDREALENALRAAKLSFEVVRSGLMVSGAETAAIGHVAFVAGVELSTLHRQKSGLEATFLSLVGEGDSL